MKSAVRVLKVLILLVIIGLALIAGAYGLYVTGFVRFNYPSVDTFPVRGIDVSHHQGRIDWGMVRKTGVHFAFIKSSEGADHRDTRFKANWSAAKEAGVARGAYHFFTFCSPGRSQAENFLSRLSSDAGELPPVADVEFAGNCKGRPGYDRIRSELGAFLRRLEAALGRRPIIYLTDDSYLRIVEGYFERYSLWPRSVIGQPSESEYGGWLFWQYAGNGRVSGIGTRVDLNVFAGTRAEFSSLSR